MSARIVPDNINFGFESLVECLAGIISESLHWEDLPNLERLRAEISQTIGGDLMDVYSLLDSQEDLGGGGADAERIGFALQNTGGRLIGLCNLRSKVDDYIRSINAAEAKRSSTEAA